MAELGTLPNDVGKLKEIISNLLGDISAREKRIDLLLEEIDLWKKRLFGPKTERFAERDEWQQDLFNEAEMESDKETCEKNENESTTHVKGYTRIKKGRKKLPASLPREIVDTDVDEKDKLCAAGKERKFVKWEITEKLDIKPPEVKVIQTRRAVYGCPDSFCVGCEDANDTPVKTAPAQPQLLEKTILTPGLAAFILVSKYCDHLPYYRLESIFNRYGIDISRQTMCRWTIQLYAKYKIFTELFQKEILSGPLIGIDETTMQVITEPDRAAQTKSYLWVFRGGNPMAPSILFEYRETRSGKFLIERLRDYAGYIQTDGYVGYDALDDLLGIILIACWAHARRMFNDAAVASKNKGSAHEALSMIQRLYLIEKQGKDLDPDDRKRLRQESSVPVLDKIKKWLDKKAQGLLPEGYLGKAIAYTLKFWPRLVRYVEDGLIPIDNNGVENALRPECLGKKNWLFAFTPSGAEASAFHYSLIATAKANGLDPYWYLRYLFEKIIDADSKDDFRSLLPQYIDKSKIREYRMPRKWG
jgi:transposase